MNNLKIRWIGQSGYILTDGKTTLCIDPYLSDVVNRIAARPRTRAVPIKPEELEADAVICTHNHLDHVDTDSIPLMKKKITFYAPQVCEKPLHDLGVENYREFDEGQSYNIGEFKITAVFAEHSVPAVGVIVEYGGEKLYFSGDTLYNKRLEVIRCDYMFVCINGRLGNMNVSEAVRLAKIIKPKLAVPNHYDMFESNSEDPKKFTDNIDFGFILDFDKEYEVKNGCLI